MNAMVRLESVGPGIVVCLMRLDGLEALASAAVQVQVRRFGIQRTV